MKSLIPLIVCIMALAMGVASCRLCDYVAPEREDLRVEPLRLPQTSRPAPMNTMFTVWILPDSRSAISM